MKMEDAWLVFEKTGNINAYLIFATLYKKSKHTKKKGA